MRIIRISTPLKRPDASKFLAHPRWPSRVPFELVEAALDVLSRQLREALDPEERVKFLTITAPNGEFRTLNNFRAKGLQAKFLSSHTNKMMTQFGRANYRIDDIVI